MRLALFGGTGTVGTELLSQTIAAGHEVRALVRDQAKVGKLGDDSERFSRRCEDAAAVTKTISGCEAVLSALEQQQGCRGHAPHGDANIMAAMRSRGIRRCVIVGGFHLHVPGDPGNLGSG